MQKECKKKRGYKKRRQPCKKREEDEYCLVVHKTHDRGEKFKMNLNLSQFVTLGK